jgi:hypothetical protein
MTYSPVSGSKPPWADGASSPWGGERRKASPVLPPGSGRESRDERRNRELHWTESGQVLLQPACLGVQVDCGQDLQAEAILVGEFPTFQEMHPPSSPEGHLPPRPLQEGPDPVAYRVLVAPRASSRTTTSTRIPRARQ